MSQPTAFPPDDIKRLVRDRYAGFAVAASSCCGPASRCCGPETEVSGLMADSYAGLAGYVPDADLGLGCGLPTEHAAIAAGEVVLDLGSGAGNDVFVARALVGDSGRVIGVDMTPEMIALSRRNAVKLGFENVEFRLGELEALPVRDGEIDVVVSNCVLNLVPDKATAFAEMARVLRPGGRFCVSDIVTYGAMPPTIRSIAALYAGCVGGALEVDDYLRLLGEAGFENVHIAEEKEISFSEEILNAVLDAAQAREVRASGLRVVSVTVVGRRPAG